MKKIIFMGTPAFSATVMEGIIESKDYELLAVVTQPDRAVGRKKVITPSPVKELALKHGLTVYQPDKMASSEVLDELIQIGADGIVTAAFGQFLPEKLLNSVDFAVNVHASLLPKYRGGAPIQYAIMNGDKETGISLIEMVKKMDAGDIIASQSLPIMDEDNAGTLFEKLAELGKTVLLDNLLDYTEGKIRPLPQKEEEVSFSPNISYQEEEIDWSKSAREVFNQVRGLYPWPIAHTTWNGQQFKIHEVSLAKGEGLPGQVIQKGKKQLLVGTGDQAIELKVVQPSGKPKMTVVDFLNGLGQKIEVGDYFGK